MHGEYQELEGEGIDLDKAHYLAVYLYIFK